MVLLIWFFILLIAFVASLSFFLRNRKQKVEPGTTLTEKRRARIEELKQAAADLLKANGVRESYELSGDAKRVYKDIDDEYRMLRRKLESSNEKEEPAKEQIAFYIKKFGALAVLSVTTLLLIQAFISMNFASVPKGEIRHYTRVIGGENLPDGHLVAHKEMTSNPFSGMKGPQANILTEGLHWFPLIGVLYEELETYNLNGAELDLTHPHVIPAGMFAEVSTRDGKPMPQDMLYAPPWASAEEFLNAETFLTKVDDQGNKLGYRGDQLTLVTGGTIRVNKILYEFRNVKPTQIQTGWEGVVRSAVNEHTDGRCEDPSLRTELETVAGSKTYLVPKGCAGVWKDPLVPNTYRLHTKAFVVTETPTRQQDFVRHGGYTKRTIKFSMGDDGKIVNVIEDEPVRVPSEAEGEAIDVHVEGWTVPVDLLTKYQITHTPTFVATIGDWNAQGGNPAEKFLWNPIEARFRVAAQGLDILRCAVYAEDGNGYKAGDYKDQACVEESRRLFDLVNMRDAIVTESRRTLEPLVTPFGMAITMQTMGHPNLPVESLLPRMKANYAKQLQATFKEQQVTQVERRKAEAARVEAENQQIVVTADLNKQAAEDQKITRQTLADARAYELQQEGVGMRDRDTEAAKGQQALLDVMGKDLVQQQALLRMWLEVAAENPDIVKVPIVAVGEGSQGTASLEGAMALLGATQNLQAVKDAGKSE